jgi:transposase
MKTAGLSTNIDELHHHIYSMADEIRHLKEQIFLLTRRQFGSSSEAFSPDQHCLFSTSDTDVVIVETEIDDNTQPSQPTPQKTLRQAVVIDKNTAVERRELDLDDDEKMCTCCGGALHKIGEDCSYQVEYIPARTKVIETARPKYGCRDCESGIKQKPVPASPIPRSMATASLLSFLIVSKYLDHQPLNRIERILKRHGIRLPRSTQCDWMMASAKLLERLTTRMRRDLLQSPQVFTDDTILPLQNDITGRGRTIQARLWVYATQQRAGPPIILYDFTRGREKAGPQNFLNGFTGYVQADAYAGYDGLYAKGAKEVACLAHCRRYFFEASELEVEPGAAHEALKIIASLYAIERAIKHYSHKKRKKQRRLKSKPLLKRFYQWLIQQKTGRLRKGKLTKAINYALNHWNAFTRYCDAGYLEIDNNYSEREMKPIALGRKNYLFAGSERGGHAAATLYSMIESAKANGHNAYDYLNDVLERLPACNDEGLDALLPYNWSAPTT